MFISRLNCCRAISLVEIMIAMAILSTLALPLSMFLIEQTRGSSQLGDYYQILNLVEERLEIAISFPFSDIPIGETTNILLESENKRKLDLRPTKISNNMVNFKLKTELVSVDMSVMKDAFTREMQTIRVEEAIKRIEITARWGSKKQNRINLMIYKANL